MVLVPLVATCTQPTGMVAEASEHLQTASEDRLAAFLIDGRIAASARR